MPPFFPEQASTIANQIDAVYFVLIVLMLLFAVPIAALIIFFTVKYHRSNEVDRTNAPTFNLRLEVAWIVIPLVLAFGMFFWSAVVYTRAYGAPPDDAIEIYIVGKQWMWYAQHPQGRRENNELHVPVNVPVRLIMTSQDVIHSFYMPAFRMKRDVLPGRYTTMWFEATDVGEYHLFCAEYCGTEHSYMRGTVTVMHMEDYQRWLAADPGPFLENIAPNPSSEVDEDVMVLPPAAAGDLAMQGAILFQQQGCVSCHYANGAGVGPALVGLYGRQVQFANGEIITADENYIRESILEPQERVLPGYPPVMPSYAGELDEEQLIQLVAYLKALSVEDASEE